MYSKNSKQFSYRLFQVLMKKYNFCCCCKSNRNLLCLSGLFTTSPFESNPRISLPTLLVRPVSASCLCRNNFKRAVPRPSSKEPCVKTPNNVLFPASTLPTTATL